MSPEQLNAILLDRIQKQDALIAAQSDRIAALETELRGSRLLRCRRDEGRDDAVGDLLKCSVDELEPTAATLLDGAHDGPSIRQRVAPS